MKFKAGDLMEGWSLKEQMTGIAAIMACLEDMYGDDTAMHTCLLSFVLGNKAAKSNITIEMVIAMVQNAHTLTKMMNGEEK